VFSIKDRAKIKLEREMGSDLLTILKDSKTIEIMLNPDGKLWQECLGEEIKYIGRIPCGQVQAIIETIAGYHGKEITRKCPILEGEFPLDGSRFAAQIPPIVKSPTFSIRKQAIQIFSLKDYGNYEYLRDSLLRHKNILIVGGTSSGKTTLANALIDEIVCFSPKERIIVIEDTQEIQCKAENSIFYHTSLDVNMTMLLKASLRMRPTRILIGEVRGEEALDLLDAWNTGHPGGIATLHANDARSGLSRLKGLITRNKSAPTDIDELIGEVVDLLIYISGKKIKEIFEVNGYENHTYNLNQVLF
jgi:type IV secretion system protein VirB11